MNAYDLAEQIDKHAQLLDNLTDFPKGVQDLRESANMLRQQADRIKELEAWQKHDIELAEAVGFERAHKLQAERIKELTKSGDKWCLKWHEACEQVADLKREISDLKYEKSSGVYDAELVAWAIKSDGDWTEIGWDDEILHEVEEWYTAQGWQYEYVPLYTHPAKTYEDAIEECAGRAEAYAYMSPNFTALAEELRAILRKSQEK